MAVGTQNLEVHFDNLGVFSGTFEDFVKYILDKFENFTEFTYHNAMATHSGKTHYLIFGINYHQGRVVCMLIPQVANIFEIFFLDREGTTDTIRQLVTQSYTPPA
jgi:hypothetical protein